MDDARVRAFLAIGLPDEVVRNIRAVQDELKRHLGGVRWVRPGGIHLTLKFFGDIGREDIERIAPAVAEEASRTAPMALTLERLGGFPDLKRTRVVWVGVGGETERLIALQNNIEECLQRIGYPREERRFRPHLTLGRARDSGSGIAGIEEALAKTEGRVKGAFRAVACALYRSELRPEGAVYTVLRNFSFDAGKGSD